MPQGRLPARTNSLPPGSKDSSASHTVHHNRLGQGGSDGRSRKPAPMDCRSEGIPTLEESVCIATSDGFQRIAEHGESRSRPRHMGGDLLSRKSCRHRPTTQVGPGTPTRCFGTPLDSASGTLRPRRGPRETNQTRRRRRPPGDRPGTAQPGAVGSRPSGPDQGPSRLRPRLPHTGREALTRQILGPRREADRSV